MSKSAKRTIGIILGTALIIAAVIAAVSYYTVLLPRSNYNAAAEAMAQEKYQDAHDMFIKLGDYQDAPKQADQAMYLLGCEYFEAFDFENARRAFQNTAYYDAAVKSKIISAYQSAAAADELLTSIPEHLTGDEIPLPHGVFAYKSTVYIKTLPIPRRKLHIISSSSAAKIPGRLPVNTSISTTMKMRDLSPSTAMSSIVIPARWPTIPTTLSPLRRKAGS